MAEDTLHSTGALRGGVKRAQELGLQVVMQEVAPPDTKDFTALILKLKRADPDVVYVEAFPGFEIPFMKQAYELGLKPREFFNGHIVEAVLKALGPRAEGLAGGSGGLAVLWAENLVQTYFLNMGLVACTWLVVWLIARSRFGLALVSIREDEAVAQTFGVPVFRHKCVALLVSAALAAALGPIYLSDRLYINPGEVFGLEMALMPITMAMLGGSGLLIGPIVGVVFLSVVQELLWTQLGILRLAALGLVLAGVGLFMPGGLARLPPVYAWLRRWGFAQEP